MNKVWTLPASENWICDRFVEEWNSDNSDITVQYPDDADVIWLLSDWCWRQLPDSLLRQKKVVTTVHHIVPEKFGYQERLDFHNRDTITTVYHVYNQRTLDFIRPLTQKPIHLIPYWANQKIWRMSTDDKHALRKKYGLPEYDSYIIGSFQRDTEGHDLISPKLEKGPDILAKFIIDMRDFWASHRNPRNVHVVLAGWRRQYIISRLQAAQVPFSYFERPKHKTVNELYQTLDLYPIAARHEGGPQALIECGLLNVPVVSRPVGIAEQVLPPYAINEDLMIAQSAIPNVSRWILPDGYQPYRNLFAAL